jgi:hypothetical protein
MFRDEDSKYASIWQLRLRAIVVATASALSRAKRLDTNHPRKFNQHSTRYRLASNQYTQHNALVALMLVVPLLCELTSGSRGGA